MTFDGDALRLFLDRVPDDIRDDGLVLARMKLSFIGNGLLSALRLDANQYPPARKRRFWNPKLESKYNREVFFCLDSRNS